MTPDSVELLFKIAGLLLMVGPIIIIFTILVVIARKTEKRLRRDGEWVDAKIMFIDYNRNIPVYDVLYTDIDGILRSARCFGSGNHIEGDIIRVRYAPPDYSIVETVETVNQRRELL